MRPFTRMLATAYNVPRFLSPALAHRATVSTTPYAGLTTRQKTSDLNPGIVQALDESHGPATHSEPGACHDALNHPTAAESDSVVADTFSLKDNRAAQNATTQPTSRWRWRRTYSLGESDGSGRTLCSYYTVKGHGSARDEMRRDYQR